MTYVTGGVPAITCHHLPSPAITCHHLPSLTGAALAGVVGSRRESRRSLRHARSGWPGGPRCSRLRRESPAACENPARVGVSFCVSAARTNASRVGDGARPRGRGPRSARRQCASAAVEPRAKPLHGGRCHKCAAQRYTKMLQKHAASRHCDAGVSRRHTRPQRKSPRPLKNGSERRCRRVGRYELHGMESKVRREPGAIGRRFGRGRVLSLIKSQVFT